MIKGDKEHLDQIVKTHGCPEHPDFALTVAWHASGTHTIRCGFGHFPEEVTRQPSLTQMLKQGDELPEPIKSNVIKSQQRRAQAQGKQSLPLVLGEIPRADLATGELLTPEVIKGLKDYADRYGLDPYRGHVCLFHGKPYITIDGYLYYAKQSGESYQLNSAPLSEEDRKHYQLPEGAHVWMAEVSMDEGRRRFTGSGIVTQEEMIAKSKRDSSKLASPVVATHPWQLAQKRAEWQALRRAFPIGETKEVEP